MRKLFYTTAIPLLISSAVAIDVRLDEIRSDKITTNNTLLVESENPTENASLVDETIIDEIGSEKYLNPASFICESRQIYNEKKYKQSRKKFTKALANSNHKEKKKSRGKIRQKNRDAKDEITHGIEQIHELWDPSEYDEKSYGSKDGSYSYEDESYGSAHLTISTEIIVALRDFALSNSSGKSSTHKWTNEENTTYIQNCFDILWGVKYEYGYLPSVAQILLGDILSIATDPQKNEVISLLDDESISFSREDVAALLNGVDSSPLDVISIENIENNCYVNDPFPLYASLLRPFMKFSITEYSESEQDDLTQIMEFIDRNLKFFNPMARRLTTHTLNVMAMFESDLARKATDNTLKELYSDVKKGKMSSALAAVAAVEKWKNDDVTDSLFEEKIAACINALKMESVRSYAWVEDDLKDFLNYRLSHPDATIPATYSEDLITENCKKIEKGELTINQATLAITAEWARKGVLDNAIADCKERLNDVLTKEKYTEGSEHYQYTPLPSDDELNDENKSIYNKNSVSIY